MTQQEVIFKVCLQGTDGKHYVITEGLRETLGINSLENRIKWLETNRNTLFDRIDRLETCLINDVYKSQMRFMIRDFLRKNPNVKTRQVTHLQPSQYPANRAFYSAWEEMQKDGEVVGTSHGEGQNRTWKLKET